MNFRILSYLGLLTGLLGFGATSSASGQTVNTLPAGTQGVAYSFHVSVAGTSYAATNLPSGLTINATSGLISGTPTVAGVFTGVITVVDTITNNYSYSLTINPPAGTPVISSPTTLGGTVGTAITPVTVTASNGPITAFNATGLAAGLSLNAVTGQITGTPTLAGTFNATLSANNAVGTGATTTLAITIGAAANAPVVNSATTASGTPGQPFTYTITATNTPTAFAAAPLPLGLSVNTLTGVISGTPTVAGITDVALTASNATGTSSVASLRITVGALPVVSTTTATGTVGSNFSLTLQANPAATSFNILSTLPTGLSFNTATNVISGTPTAAGVTNISLSANNATGTGPAATLSLTINTSSGGGGSGGGGSGSGGSGGGASGGGGGGGTVVSVPIITVQPAAQQATVGSAVTFSIAATGANLAFQWSKDGTPINGATSSSFVVPSVSLTDAGSYVVVVSNSAGAVASAVATLAVVTPTAAPIITVQPAAQVATAGGNATFSVTATGTSPLTYQWRKDGAAITGATNAALALSNVPLTAAGNYSVVVTNSAGSATSTNAALTVNRHAIGGAYFGALGSDGGTFALFVRGDGTGVFLGNARSAKVGLVSRDIVVDANGHFAVTVVGVGGTVAQSSATSTAAAAYSLSGDIAADGSLTGAVSGLGLSFAAAPAATAGATAGLAGYYPVGAAGNSATGYLVVGAGGDAYVLTVNGATVDAGRGAVSGSGQLTATTDGGAQVSGALDSAAGTVTAAVSSAGTVTTYIGANNDARSDVEKLVNISTRGRAGAGADALIAGFVIAGDQPKQVLVRAIGPTLGQFGLGGVLSAAHLEVVKAGSATPLATGNDWGAAANASTIASTAVRVGAFALPVASHDAALLLTLDPGNYTAMVTGQTGAAGIALVEVYDATNGPIPRAQRLINISTRSTAGAGDSTMIAGFVVTGTVPKRVLIRGVGPALAQFGLTGVLSRPQLLVTTSDNKPIAQNAGWSTSIDAANIATVSAQAGAFALPAGSADAALILNLAPGVYGAQVTGVAGSTGVALVEVYEVP